MHMFTNIAKTVFELICSRYNKSYKCAGHEKYYPFEISNSGFTAIQNSVDSSRHLISSSAFKGSFLAANPSNQKFLFRSSDWIDYLQYIIPSMVCPLLENQQVKDGLSSLVRGISLSLQFTISSDDLIEIER